MAVVLLHRKTST